MAETPVPPPLTLAVGDRVVYPNQGVCRVTSVESKEVAGQTLTFVTMKREEDGAVVMVPEAKVRAIGIRKVSARADVERVFAFLRSESDKANLDWKQRARTNVERMSQGGLLGLAEVVKGLQVLSELRPLPTKERELYDNARHLLVAELAAGLGIAECDAEDAIDLVLSPPGRERPKRTAEEFKQVSASDDEGIELGADLLSLGGDLELPSDEEAETEEAAETAQADGEEEAAAGKGRRAKAGAEAKKASTDGRPVARHSKKRKGAAEGSKPKAEAKPRSAKLAAAHQDSKAKRKAGGARLAKPSARKKK